MRDPRVGSVADDAPVARARAGSRPADGLLPARPRHGAAPGDGRAWVRRTGLTVPAERVIITSGAQHGAATVLASLARPGTSCSPSRSPTPDEGDREPAAPPASRRRDRRRRDHSRGLRGGLPRESRPRALYCMPTLQNPTGRTMPLARRQAIAEIAARYEWPGRGRRLRLPARRSLSAARRPRSRQRLLHHQHLEEHGAGAAGGVRGRAGVASGSGGRR